MPFRLGSVNCYIVAAEGGFVVIDTGASNRRKEVERELENAGCKPGGLKLIILTHGDFDHTGNVSTVVIMDRFTFKPDITRPRPETPFCS